MLKVITAVEDYKKEPGEVTCFLAGGITDCGEWQDEVIKNLIIFDKEVFDLTGLVILNPRRKKFPIHDPNASNEQITWEFNMLEQMDIFSMYFANSKSVQPICMYELGRNLVKMENRFPDDFKNRIAITIEEGFSRTQDVIIQTKLALNGYEAVSIEANSCCEAHAAKIIMAFIEITKNVKLKDNNLYDKYFNLFKEKPGIIVEKI